MRIVPTNKLILVAALVVLPLTLLLAFRPNLAIPAVLLTGLLAAVALLDACKAPGRLAGLEVILPEIVRLSKFRNGEIKVNIENKNMSLKRIRLGLAFPAEILSPTRELATKLPADAVSSFLNWPCRGAKQGNYFIHGCLVEALSPKGFWAIRKSLPARLEIRVYPNLMVERKHLSSLFLNRGLGIHTQRQVGKGREFEQLREYQPGDSFEDIHWKATARRGQPITKVYQIERTQQVYVIIDSSRLSARPIELDADYLMQFSQKGSPHSATILERYITATLVMCLAAERQGDLFGLVTFNDQVHHYLGAKNGKSHFNSCRDAIYTLQPQRVAPDFTELFAFIGSRIRRRSLLVFLTHLDDPVLAESFADSIDIISRKHLILVNMLRPASAGPIFSSGPLTKVDEIYRKLGGHLVWKNLRETEKKLQHRGADFAMLENETLCTELISQYLTLKKRQIL
jgi:uncharacterized protein (DUF58 family)